MHDIFWYSTVAIIGAMLGFSSGMFGIGGALIGTPLLAIFAGLPPHLALATPLPAALPSAISGSIVYYRKQLINMPLLLRVLPFALPFNFFGTWITKYASGNLLMYITGAFILVIGFTFFIRGWMLKPDEGAQPNISWISAGFAGALAGFLSGLLAIGGGMALVPLFVRVNRLSLKSALATSLLCVAVLSLPGSAGHFILGHINMQAALTLTIFVVPAANIGARFAVKLRNATLERIYGTFMIIFAVYFIATR